MARRSAAETRAAILEAASRRFREHGYAGASVRDIARDAGSDAALVIRHFGSKELLFLEAMRPSIDASWLREGPIEELGERIVREIVSGDEDVRGVFLALVRASDGAGVSGLLRQVHEDDFVAPLRERLEGPEAEVRARLAAAMIGGLLYAFWLVGDETLLGHDREDVIARYGAALQAIVEPGNAP